MFSENKYKEILKLKWTLYEDDIFALNDYMALNPEIGSEEYKSSEAIVTLLRKNGIEVEYPFVGLDTAFKGVINPEKKNRVALLAEYDALRGLGHACGHCASGSASVLAALALNSVKEQLDFGVDIIGTPDEEFEGRKCKMADEGIFDEYDFAAMVHMGPFTTAEVNFIALDGTGIKWHGKPAHAAGAPENGRNALNAARLFLDAVDMMRQHMKPDVKLHGIIKNGGSASNIVPDFAEIEFLSRAPKREDLDEITAWLYDCGKAAAVMTKTEVEIFYIGAPFHELHISNLERNLMEECFEELDIPYSSGKIGMTGSSDIGNVDYRCPAFHPIMSIGKNYECHTQEFADEMCKSNTHDAIRNSAKLLLLLIAKIYGNKSILDELKQEHKEYRKY